MASPPFLNLPNAMEQVLKCPLFFEILVTVVLLPIYHILIHHVREAAK
jgi:hypothetical protein